jgi:4-amino-4-deoxy-L-arabinose transferase-like glycosyltransferase
MSITPPVPTDRPRKLLWPVVLILLLAAATRFHDAAHRPVWTDEGFMAWITSDLDFHTVIDRAEQWDRHPPLYDFWVGEWRTVAGDSRIALRFWAIMSGLLSTALVYRIGADAWNERAARFAALLYAVLHMAVYYAQEIRGYGLLMLSVCLMTFFFVRYLRHPRNRWLIGYALSVALMLYTVYLGVLVLAVQGLITLVWRGTWRQRFKLAGAVAAGVALFAPWLIVLLRHTDRVRAGIKGAPGTYDTTLANLRTLATFLWGDQLALTAGLYLLGVWWMVRKITTESTEGTEKSENRNSSFLLSSSFKSVFSVSSVVNLYFILAGGGLFALMVVANVWWAMLSARTLVFLTPFLMLVTGYGLALIQPRAREVFAALLVLLTLTGAQVIQPRLDYDVVARTVAAGYSPGDLVLLETGWDDNPFRYELSLALPAGADIVRTLPWIDPGSIAPVVPQVADTVRAYRRVWIVQWLTPPQVIPWLMSGEDGYRLVSDQTVPVGQQYAELYPDFPTVRVLLFERPALNGPPRVYGHLLALHDAILPATLAPGDKLHVDLWWSALEPPPLDYSVGVYLMAPDEDRVIAQHDGPPGAYPTSQWVPGQWVFDRHTLAVPHDLAPGVYRVAVGAYWFGDNQPLDVNGAAFVVVGQVTIR